MEAVVQPLPNAPIATVNGQVVIDLPQDLYIPPDAMKVFLETFEGPLDFSLYLIRKQNIDILDIPIAKVTQQYMEYIDLMQGLRLELAAEYLVMAAILAEIKSRMLLPVIVTEEGEEDPRAELVERLKAYERYKAAAEKIDALPREERDFFLVNIDSNAISILKPAPQVSLQELLAAFATVMQRAALSAHHQIEREPISIQERMSYILESLRDKPPVPFTELFCVSQGRLGIVVTFLAMLELSKENLIELVQTQAYSTIYLKIK